jgi:hypothetical protein
MTQNDTSRDREPVSPPPGARAGWPVLLGSRAAAPALVVLFFAALAVVNTYPLARTPASVIGVHGDAYFSVWRLAWVAHQLRTDPRHLFDGNIFHPERQTLAYSDAMLLPATVLAPLHWAGVGPLASTTSPSSATFVLNALAAYLLGVAADALAWRRACSRASSSPSRRTASSTSTTSSCSSPSGCRSPCSRGTARCVTDATRAYLAVAALASAQVLSCIYYSVFLLTWLGCADRAVVLARAASAW